MRAVVLTLVGTVLGQDVFLSKYNASEELDETASRRRRRRRRSSTVCTGGDLPTCVNKCLTTDSDANFKKCESGGSTDCSESKCCGKEGWSCFVKNAYWASCAPRCKTGIPDSMGETWDCTPISSSKCKTLQPCVNDCHKNCPSLESAQRDDVDDDFDDDLDNEVAENVPSLKDPRPKRGPEAPRGRGVSGCRGDSMKECKSVCHYADKALEKMCNDRCEESCPPEPPVVCPKKNLGVCVAECQEETLAPQHNDGCEENGRTSCLKSHCCKNPSDKCYTKNKYWAACQDECVPGKKNKNDNMIWQCKELKPRKVCDDYLYRTCVSDCATQCLE